MTTRLPRGWREGHGGDLACPHRDVSVCPKCAADTWQVMEVYGHHFWVDDIAERAALKAQMSEADALAAADRAAAVK